MHICIFEDKLVDNFYPLTLSHPVYDLVCGMKTLREKILRYFPNAGCTLFCRKYLEDTVKQNNPGIEVNKLSDDNYLFINGRVLIDENFHELIGKGTAEKIFVKDNILISAKITAETIKKIKLNSTDSVEPSLFEGIPEENADIDTINFIWD
ncbi:MAG TPA: putative sugar nucleotidyl transferase, partial [Ignavibacteriaceae bacterium]|nr:putative sugar nucleotidyl transferase [Ignavibacteriaceae bacterium]